MILLDTQVVLWMNQDKRRLSVDAAKAIRETRQAAGGLGVASSTLWEIAMLASKGRIQLRGTLSNYLRFLEGTYTVLPITAAIAERSMLFIDRYPHDPTDRLIGATAVVHGLQLVTADRAIRESKQVECIW